MNDLRVASINRILTVTGVQVRSDPPRSLMIYGVQLHFATVVLVNGIKAEFIVLSSSQILAQIPSSQVGKTLSGIMVLTDVPANYEPNKIIFGVGSSLRTLSGFDGTIQTFCKLLLQSPGTDRFNPTRGGGLLSVVGMDAGEQNKLSLQARVVDAIVRARNQLVALQGKNRRLSNDERLSGADLMSIGYNESTTAVPAVVKLTSVSGRSALAGLEV